MTNCLVCSLFGWDWDADCIEWGLSYLNDNRKMCLNGTMSTKRVAIIHKTKFARTRENI